MGLPVPPAEAVAIELSLNLVQGFPGFLKASGIGLEPETDPLHFESGRCIPQRQGAPDVEGLAPLLKTQPCPLDCQLRIEVGQAVAKVHG